MNDESAPKGAPETRSKASSTSLPHGVKGVKEPAPVSVIEFDYTSATKRERDVYDCAWFWASVNAFNEGFAAGRAERIAEEEASWQSMAASIKAAGGAFAGVRYSALCELRGEREAADLARTRERLLFERVRGAS